MTKEIWKDIKGFEGIYQVSNLGNVKSLERYRIYKNRWGQDAKMLKPEQILTPSVSSNGYLIVSLCKNGTRQNASVHRLVAEAFLPNPHNKPCVDHINRDKTTNCVSNLRWVSSFDNMQNRDYDSVRVKNGKPIVQYDLDGNYVNDFKSVEDAGRVMGCSAHIRRCLKHKQDTAYGYKWEYKEKGGA